MIRVAAVGDVHASADSAGLLHPSFEGIEGCADLLLLAGDLTKWGDPEEAEVLAQELSDVPIPIFAVLGNHDHHLDRPQEVRCVLERSGIVVLERETAELRVDGVSVGIAGAKGFGGGFTGPAAPTSANRR